MARMISIAKGRTNVYLPDGKAYNGGNKIVLTGPQWAALDPALLANKTVFDWGDVPEPVPGPAGVQGPAGPQGATGRGVRRWYGDGPPDVVVGASPGDEYVDRLSGDLWTL